MKKIWNKPSIFTIEPNDFKKEIALYATSGTGCGSAVSMDIKLKI